MKRKEISHLAIDLIEEALENPNTIIVLEERITKPTCEPGIKEPTEKKLETTRKDVLSFIFYASKNYRYSCYAYPTQRDLMIDNPHAQLWDNIIYTNGSRIKLRR